MCYNDGCHLRQFVQNPERKSVTPVAATIASLSIYVDKTHIRGHTDAWCLRNCDPRPVKDLEIPVVRMYGLDLFVIGNSRYALGYLRTD